jgi:hypothetical protein
MIAGLGCRAFVALSGDVWSVVLRGREVEHDERG